MKTKEEITKECNDILSADMMRLSLKYESDAESVAEYIRQVCELFKPVVPYDDEDLQILHSHYLEIKNYKKEKEKSEALNKWLERKRDSAISRIRKLIVLIK